MTTFTRTWNAAYEASPADTDVVSQGALRIRNLKEDVQERGEVDHSWAGDVDDAKHKQITFVDPLGADPGDVADEGMLYTKNVSAKAELFWKDEDGNVAQLTDAGVLKETVITGEIRLWTTASAPTNWLICDGAAVSRTTYAALFAVISTTFGVGDGSTTFNLPDFEGRSPIGVGTSDAARASAWTLAEKPTTGAGGEESHVQTEAELVGHTHTGSVVNFNDVTGDPGPGFVTQSGNTGSTGGGDPFNITQPVLGINFIIRI